MIKKNYTYIYQGDTFFLTVSKQNTRYSTVRFIVSDHPAMQVQVGKTSSLFSTEQLSKIHPNYLTPDLEGRVKS